MEQNSQDVERMADPGAVAEPPTEPVAEPAVPPVAEPLAEAIRAAIEQEAAVFRLCGRLQYACFGVTLLIMLLCGLAFGLDAQTYGWILFNIYLAFTFLSIIAIKYLMARGTTALREMTLYERLETVGIFVDLLEGTSAEVRDLARGVLLVLLPRLKASDASLLDERRRAMLNRQLQIERAVKTESKLMIAILAAWEQIGDEKAIPAVEELVREYPYTRAERDVYEAAQACLPTLRDRAGRDRQRNLLLRPAGEPNPEGTLLRPAAVTGTPETVLLRTVEEEAE